MVQVEWNRQIFDEFCDKAILSDDEIFIMLTRLQGWTISEQAKALNLSEDAIKYRIKKLKIKYDNAQKCSDVLPPRRKSKKEEWMDTH